MRACGLGVPDSDFPDLRVALGESALWRVFARAPLFLPFWIMPATRKAILLPRSKGIVSARVTGGSARDATRRRSKFPVISRFWVFVPGSNAPKFPLRPTSSDD